jgi:hypothetical protein
MSIHSKFLIHWTGKKDIETQIENEKAQLYFDRLKDYYRNGLFLKRTEEATIRRMRIKNIVRLCFTEIRLSQTHDHSDRYGRLGIGFAREFIINRGGRPVIYIPFKADICVLEESIRNIYENSKNHKNISTYIKTVFAYIKRMHNNDKQEIDYYEEMEWRLVFSKDYNAHYFTRSEDPGIFRLKFDPADVKVIIFPDEKTRRMALDDGVMMSFFSRHLPITVTLDDCGNF